MPSERPLGDLVDWSPVSSPSGEPLRGAHVLLRPLDPAADAEPLYAASHAPDGDPAVWTYLPDGPYESREHLRQALAWAAGAEGHIYYAIEPLAIGRSLGQASYLRIEPAFDDLGYRRLEWKCDALNAASRRAAERFGFRFEGIFRNHQVIKGRNRDTAWYAITDEDCPAVRAAFEAWLAPENFNADGSQKRPLEGPLASEYDPQGGDGHPQGGPAEPPRLGSARMPDIAHTKIEEIDAIEGFFEGIRFHRAGAGLGIDSFGLAIIDLAPGADQYPEHDHSPGGIGGQMFAKRPQQLGQEEVYVALKGSGTLEADGERYPIDADHISRLGPDVKRKVTPGPDGLRLLVVGATPGEPYDTGGRL